MKKGWVKNASLTKSWTQNRTPRTSFLWWQRDIDFLWTSPQTSLAHEWQMLLNEGPETKHEWANCNSETTTNLFGDHAQFKQMAPHTKTSLRRAKIQDFSHITAAPCWILLHRLLLLHKYLVFWSAGLHLSASQTSALGHDRLHQSKLEGRNNQTLGLSQTSWQRSTTQSSRSLRETSWSLAWTASLSSSSRLAQGLPALRYQQGNAPRQRQQSSND